MLTSLVTAQTMLYCLFNELLALPRSEHVREMNGSTEHILEHNRVLVAPLQRYIRKASPTGRELGSGTYGAVIELESAGELVAGKVFKNISHAQLHPILDKLYGEIILMMTVHHPNIVESRGVCFLEHPMPVLLMERLMSSLHDYLLDPSHQAMQLTAKVSILCNVASGLSYLHSHKPAVVHCDLTARNVLLDSNMKAKIGDFGNARLMDLDPSATPQTFTSLSGTLEYMPPEASGQHAHYDPSLDVFSFGHLALFTLVQSRVVLLPHSYSDSKGDHLRSELMRRQESVSRAEQILGKKHALLTLIRDSLHNNPALRPRTEEVVAKLQTTMEKAEHSGQTTPSTAGGSVAHPVTYPTPPLPDQKPTLQQLRLLKSPSGERVEIISTIAADWKDFGTQLNFDKTGRTLDCIAIEHQLRPIDCCTHMMREWLEGRGRQPATWATLILLLKDVQINDLAQQLERMILGGNIITAKREMEEETTTPTASASEPSPHPQPPTPAPAAPSDQTTPSTAGGSVAHPATHPTPPLSTSRLMLMLLAVVTIMFTVLWAIDSDSRSHLKTTLMLFAVVMIVSAVLWAIDSDSRSHLKTILMLLALVMIVLAVLWASVHQ